MKKLFITLAILAISTASFAGISDDTKPATATEQVASIPDSLNIPVVLLDGVEVPYEFIFTMDLDDVAEINVIMDESVNRLFAPRKGGVIKITSKSKAHLRRTLQDYEEALARKRSETTEVRIR